jgi:hypothetical protein
MFSAILLRCCAVVLLCCCAVAHIPLLPCWQMLVVLLAAVLLYCYAAAQALSW